MYYEEDQEYNDHHYYGHVEDLRGTVVLPFFLIPFYFVLLVFLLVTGLWPLLLLYWVWPREIKEDQ